MLDNTDEIVVDGVTLFVQPGLPDWYAASMNEHEYHILVDKQGWVGQVWKSDLNHLETILFQTTPHADLEPVVQELKSAGWTFK